MKKIITYSLLILVFVAFNYKAIDFFLKISDNPVSCSYDCDCEEEETEKSDDKSEKKEARDYFFSNNIYELSLSAETSFKQQSEILFSSSDYSMAVYSPPEQAVI